MRPLALLLPSVLALAADLPLGLVEQVEPSNPGPVLTLRFDGAPAAVAPGRMIGIYGAGGVERHPLTEEVIIIKPKLVAKAQVERIGGKTLARVLWLAQGETVSAGMDAIPVTDAVPNGAPVLGGEPATASSLASGPTPVPLLVTDPDNDPLSVSWTLKGTPGKAGRLVERSTASPTALWIAPVIQGDAVLTAQIRDGFGHLTNTTIPLKSTGATGTKGELKPLARLGGTAEPAVSALMRASDGTWWGITSSKPALVRYLPGWGGAGSPIEAVPKPLAIADGGAEIHVLDGERNQVTVFDLKGVPRRTYGALTKPRDVLVGADGLGYVADPGAGGVLVYEANGKLRCRLGGLLPDSFHEPIALARTTDGTVLCLDAGIPAILRFDRNHKLLDPLPVANDAANPPIDIAIHPDKGVLVLRQNGRIDILGTTPAGIVQPLGSSGLIAEPGNASHVAVDGSGETFVTYAGGSIARYGRDLVLAGVRSAALRNGNAWATDGNGGSYALDPDRGTIAVFDAEGWLTTRLGKRKGDGGTLEKPVALAAAVDGSAVYVLDRKECNIQVFSTAEPKKAPRLISRPGTAVGNLEKPVDLAVDENGRVYVLDAGTHRVSVFEADGTLSFVFGRKGNGPDELADPERIAISADGSIVWLYDSDRYDLKALKVDHGTKTVRFHAGGGGKGTSPGQVKSVVGMAVDRLGRLYVLDDSRKDLQVMTIQGGGIVSALTRDMASLGLPGISKLAVDPDGTTLVLGDGQGVLLRW